MLSETSEMVWLCTTRTVVSHWGTAGGTGGTERSLDDRVEQKESDELALVGCPAPRLGVRDIGNVYRRRRGAAGRLVALE